MPYLFKQMLNIKIILSKWSIFVTFINYCLDHLSQRKAASVSGQNLSDVFSCCCVIVFVVVVNFSHFYFHPESDPIGQFKLVWGRWREKKNQLVPGMVYEYEKTSCFCVYLDCIE